MKNKIFFELIHQSRRSRARVGRIHTPHGVIETPGFVPVATNATIKTVESSLINQLDVQLMFCNTYHLLLHPGPEVVAAAGGLHRFMNRPGPIITDSGGFQVFSLAYGGVADELKSRGKKKSEGSVLRITEDGVLFRSYRDGSPVLLTPESSVQVQKSLGADIIIPLDELVPYHLDPRALRRSLERTHRWEERSLIEHKNDPREQAMYAVIPGSVDMSLRERSCAYLQKLPFDGFAIGGSLGKTREEMIALVGQIVPLLSGDKPRHLLGIGDLPSLEACILFGIDTFDSAHPTKCARHGILFSDKGPINLTRSYWKTVHEPVSDAPFCREYSASYLHHLFKTHEVAAHQLATLHNVDYMMRFMRRVRERILADEI
ncbi:MAG: tRNA-guanosine(34) transglycosylase [Candidatus Babeliaceae bacterium]|nr:tRNA-guanosine(34) transglycosylase [Candidatus Babeliaceae bacterium]